MSTDEIAAAVAATLRYLAGQPTTDSDLRDWMAETAAQVAVLTADQLRASTCPVCEEMTCDGGCPLEGIRAGVT
jgi:hypothetical protein